MNERTFYWNSPKELAQKVIKLDKIERRKFFQSLEMHDVPMGSLMGFTKIQIDDDGRVSFYCKPQESIITILSEVYMVDLQQHCLILVMELQHNVT